MKFFINEYLRTNLTISSFCCHHFLPIFFQIFQTQLLFVFQFHLQLVQPQLPVTQNTSDSNNY